MTIAQHISRVFRQTVRTVAETMARIYALADVIIRIHEIEISKRVGSLETVEKIRKELDRYKGGSALARRQSKCDAGRATCEDEAVCRTTANSTPKNARV